MRLGPGTVAVVWVALCAACDPAPEAAPAAWSAPPAGATVVESATPAWGEAEAWRVTASPRVEVGVVTGAWAHELHDVADAALQADGDVVVADVGATEVRLYRADGSFARTLGSAGAAPGEFRRPTRVHVGPDDSIRVWDDASWRLTLFDAEGTLVRVRTVGPDALIDPALEPLYPAAAVPLEGQELLVLLAEKGKPPVAAGRFRERAGALRVGPDGSAERVAMLPGREQVVMASPWGPLPVEPPLARGLRVAVRPGAAEWCLGPQERFEVRCWRAGGAVQVVRWREAGGAVAPTDAEVAAWREGAVELYAGKLAIDEARRLVASVPVPETRPPYRAIALDPRGNLWVDRGPLPDGGRAHHVFAPTGGWLGTVRLPNVRVLWVGTDRLLAVREDELGVQFLGVYDVVRPPRSADVR